VLHGLVYCPGSINLKPIQSLTEKDFLADYQINLIGAFKVIKASLKSLRASSDASVVLFSTVAAGTGMGFHASIAAAKGAVEGFARSVAAELAPKNIRVNVIAPSLTDTPMAAQLLSSDEKREASAKRHPLGKIGSAKQIAGLAGFLLTTNASWMTGQVIGIDGGLSKIK
jgi:3-oxoacyl-[acyl-carrier protein] reductase